MNGLTEIHVPEIAASPWKELLGSPTPPFTLDGCEAWEVSRGRIPAAEHIPMNSIPDRLGDLPRDRTTVVYRAEGIRSYRVVAWLQQQGFDDVKILEGGRSAWEPLKYEDR